MDVFHVFVFRPAASPAAVDKDNVFVNWPNLVAAMGAAQGRKILEFDDSQAAISIPPGVWDMTDVSWTGFAPRASTSASPNAVVRPRVAIQDGARFTNFRMIGGQLTIVNNATTTPPIADFRPGDQVQIGLRDDGGNTELVNMGTAPLFDVGIGILFFVQNAIFGRDSLHPLIRFRDTERPLLLNLLGLNQTGNNLVRTDSGCKVVFAALSPAAQVGSNQSSIVDTDGIRFGPVGRIQRQVLPLPPAAPATQPMTPDSNRQFFTLPNVLLRCDGRAPGVVQPLPDIRTGFTMGVGGTVAVYSGGQEVVVAEVSGGTHLRIRPAPGNTVDGSADDVPMDAWETRTFASDGASNWITISMSRAPFGMARVETITAVVETAAVPGAGTNADVYLGLGGREFRCDTARNNFQPGESDTFVFGDGANVLNSEDNNPQSPPLLLSRIDRFPVYVRLDPASGTPWRFSRLTVKLGYTPAAAPIGFSSAEHFPGGLWLGDTTGAIVHLDRSSEV